MSNKPIYVMRFPGSISKEAADNLREHAKEALGDVRVLILGNGGHLYRVDSVASEGGE